MRIILGDSLEKLKDLPTSTIDACVTDPPYGLAFMGKKWDYDVPSVELWREVYRVLKPGAHLLSFGGTRTYHRLACAIEDAGFEIRDQVMWIYGSGFPKSLDVSKAIDKAAGAKREVIGSTVSGKILRANGQNERPYQDGQDRIECPITAPATDAAKQWQGWGTALKPANEPIVVARKPLEKGLTVAENVLRWGVGAINVDASRIATSDKLTGSGSACLKFGDQNTRPYQENFEPRGCNQHAQGRWPANALFDESAAAMLDEQASEQKLGRSGGNKAEKIITDENSASNTFGKNAHIKPGVNSYSDSGGASRFFYVAKTSKRERNAGLEGLSDKFTKTMNGGIGGREHSPDEPTEYNKNHHPTVKPIKLMEYLIRMVTPTGGAVLDPFLGSGTTLCAAARLGFTGIGIERESDYIEIAKRRIEYWANQKEEIEEQNPDQLEMTL